MKKLILLNSALLLSGTAANAQSLALPNADAPNFSASVGPTLTRAKLKIGYGSSSSSLYGVTATFSWNIDRNNSIRADIGVQYNSDNYYGIAEKDTVIPHLLSYSYSWPFGEDDQFAVRVGPTIGLTYLSAELSEYGYSYSDSDIAITYGIGIGFTYHINQKLVLDAAYRFLKTETFAILGYDGKLDTHSLTVSIGFKF